MSASRRSWLVLMMLVGVVALLAWFGSRDRGVTEPDRPTHVAGEATIPARGAVAPAHPFVDPVRTASIGGTVTARGGGPIAGASVCATARHTELASTIERDPFCTTTGRDGRYRIEHLPAAAYVVTAHARAHVPSRFADARGREAILLAPGQSRADVDLVLAAGGVPIRGVVQDATGGVIEGAWVTAMPGTWPTARVHKRAGWSVRTDAAGAFEIWVARREAELWAEADGYAPGSRAVAAPSEDVVLRLLPEAVIEGTVVRAETRAPVADALVRASARGTFARAYTDEYGRFRLDRLAPDRYGLVAQTNDAYGRARKSVVIALGEHVEIEIEVHPAALVSARVVDETDDPCGSGRAMLVDAKGDVRPATIEGDGSVRIRGVTPAEYTVMIECDDKLAPPDPPTLVVGTDPLPEQVWRVASGSAIAGIVVDDTGTAVPDAITSASPAGEAVNDRISQGSATTSDDGRFAIRGLRAASYRITAHTTGYARAGEGVTVDLATGGASDLRLVLPRGARIHGTVKDATGQPIPDVQVLGLAADPHGKSVRAFTNVDGHYEIADAEPRKYRMHAEGMEPDTGPLVTVVAGADLNVDLVARARDGMIEGRVVDGSGDPIADVSVSASRNDYVGWAWRDPTWVLTDEHGRFAIEGLAEGTYDLRAARGDTVQGEIEAVATGRTVEIVLAPLASLAGSVALSGGGSPERFDLTLHGPKVTLERFEHGEGRFVVEGLPAGAYEIVAKAAEGTGSTKVELATGATVDDISIEIAQRGTITGLVVDDETGEPVPGLSVRASDPAGVFRYGPSDLIDAGLVTDAQGRFAAKASPGRVVLHVRTDAVTKPRYLDAHVPVDVPAGVSVDVGTIRVPRARIGPDDERGAFGFRYDVPEDRHGSVGAKITEVTPRMPMAKAGFVVGDEIVALDGHDVRGARAFDLGGLLAVPPETTITFALADGRSIAVTAVARGP